MVDWSSGTSIPMLTREEYVAKVLREAILQSELKPGERLDQTKIAKQLRVSRTPVRNALLILSNEGLVEMSPHVGAVVSEMAPEEIEEIYFIRGALEGIAGRLAAAHISDQDLVALSEILKDLSAARAPEDWVMHDKRFHFQIYRLIKRPRLLSLITSIHDLTLPYSYRFIGSSEHKRIATVGHKLIFEACQRRDGLLVEAAIKQHMEAVCEGVLRSCEQSSLAFEETYNPD